MPQSENPISSLTLGQRASLAFGVVAMLALSAAAFFWLYRVEYQPLYRDLNQEDAAKIIAQLQEMKVPYRLGDDGTTILVDSEKLNETRVMLDGGTLSIRGGEGFELFDNIDYGMTEFAQKINYQRALQGELSRTIIGLTEVRYARVHLVLPEQALFQATRTTPKASITVVQEPGYALSNAQIVGIQELVASAVEGLEPTNVTVLNEQGMVMSKGQFGDDNGMEMQLGRKREVELHLVRKTETILDQVYGYGNAIVNIDVALSYDQVQLTRETYLPSEHNPESGLVNRSRTQREFQRPERESGSAGGDPSLASETFETDYTLGKSVEQVVKGTGAIERITVSVMVPDSTTEEVLAGLRQLVANAVGLLPERGDSIEIVPLPSAQLESMREQEAASTPLPDPPLTPAPALEPPPAAGGLDMAGLASRLRPVLPLLLLAGLLLVALLCIAVLFRSGRSSPEATLTEDERHALLAELQQWMEQSREERA